MPNSPQPPSPPPLMDSPDAREIYASEVVGTGTIGNSIAISLAAHRWVVPELGGDMRLARVVVARLVLSSDAAMQLSRRLAALARPDAARQAAPAGMTGHAVRPGPRLRAAPAPRTVAVQPAAPQRPRVTAHAVGPAAGQPVRTPAPPAKAPAKAAARGKPRGKPKSRSKTR